MEKEESKEPKKHSFIAFLLGVVIGRKVIPFFMHLIYWAAILVLVYLHFIR